MREPAFLLEPKLLAARANSKIPILLNQSASWLRAAWVFDVGWGGVVVGGRIFHAAHDQKSKKQVKTPKIAKKSLKNAKKEKKTELWLSPAFCPFASTTHHLADPIVHNAEKTDVRGENRPILTYVVAEKAKKWGFF